MEAGHCTTPFNICKIFSISFSPTESYYNIKSLAAGSIILYCAYLTSGLN